MISPTALPIRFDDAGDGHFGASRGNRLHQGVDFLCMPGQPIIMPAEYGRMVRIARPYADGEYQGVLIRAFGEGTGKVEIKIFYIVPFFRSSPAFSQRTFLRSELIGFAQNIAEKYGPDSGMRPHVHLEMRIDGQTVDPEKYLE